MKEKEGGTYAIFSHLYAVSEPFSELVDSGENAYYEYWCVCIAACFL